jgi:TonB family protein
VIASAKKRSSKAVWSIVAGVAVIMAGLAYGAIHFLLNDEGPKRRRQVQMVTLVKPPPPPVVKEKPPEPEVQKKEEIVEPEKAPEETEQTPDEPPPGQDLGVDAEGSGSGDGFGLVGRKGGQALIGSSGDRTLMQRYAWYTRMIQEEIRKKINEHMARNGGIPEGEHKALVEIVLDAQGRVVDFQLRQSSGNSHMDEALKQTLAGIRVNEEPPEGMPRSIRLKVSSKG